MEFERYLDSQCIKGPAAANVLGTLEWHESCRSEAAEHLERAQQQASDVLVAARSQADEIVSQAQDAAAKKAETAALEINKKIAAKTSEHALGFVAALTEIEGDLGSVLSNAMHQLFDLSPKPDLVAGTIRRALSRHGEFEKLRLRASPETLATFGDWLSESKDLGSDVTIIADLGMLENQVLLEGKQGSTDISPDNVIKSFVETIPQRKTGSDIEA